jgi:hypothetical protein
LIADFGDLRMLAAYFPGGKLKAPFFEVCTAQAEASTVPFLLFGDLNTGRNDIDNLSSHSMLPELWRSHAVCALNPKNRRIGRITDIRVPRVWGFDHRGV